MSRDTDRRELESDPFLWSATLFPTYVTDPFGDHQQALWQWAWGIRPGIRPAPFVAAWFRGGAKSTSAEMVAVALGARKARRYGLYICSTQEQADDHVGNVGSMLESGEVEAFYPELVSRMVGKYGNSKGWRRNRLRCSNGFTIDAIGLDTAARGIKLEEQRPDFFIVDDIDEQDDTPKTTAKKIKALTTKLLPAGSKDAATLAIQNLVHPDSIFSRLVDGRADFLADRVVSGPIPAVVNLETEQRDGFFHIVGGTATWEGMDLIACQEAMNEWGYTAFLSEAQHDVEPPPGGMFDHLDFQRCTWDDLPDLVRTVVWVDPAVTDTDQSDSMGIQADALGADGKIYRLWSWEQRTSPVDAITRAITKAFELGATEVGIETDQGGDTWQSVYKEALAAVRLTHPEYADTGSPRFRWEKAGAGHGPKAARAGKMLAGYETARFVHVEGTHQTLERALRRFPLTKPFDLCLVAGTVIATPSGAVPIESLTIGDSVLTRSGPRSVAVCGLTNESSETWRVETASGRVLEGTANHPVWTENRGWVGLADLRYRDMVTVCDNPQDKASLLTKWSSGGADSFSTKGGATTTLRGWAKATMTHSIARCGSPFTAPFRRAWTFITSTAMSETTTPQTWWPSPAPNIATNTAQQFRPKLPSPTLPRFDRSQPNGIGVPKAARGTASTGGTLGSIGRGAPSYAKNAANRFRLATPISPSFARVAAETVTGTGIRLTRWSGPALNAVRHFWPTSTGPTPASVSVAVDHVRCVTRGDCGAAVYNLSVDGEPEYFANGILVHNCDAAFWAQLSLTKNTSKVGRLTSTQVAAATL